MVLLNNEVIVQYKDVSTINKVVSGWNYIAVNIDEIYEYSYMTMYNRYETMPITNGYYHIKYETVFAGMYTENIYNYFLNDGVIDRSIVIVLGCKVYANFRTIPYSDDTPYGLCM